ncbi:hypothetical protein CALCODRAFT_506173 [Calocera cornea HHB12733]|uniref:Uncharacterized protein n=1 Tax=Calocera cornea HHB12733 TaxID=1353952 RepID=A0A165JBE0_9BASI|nr:hypothetical protein CALCODRAFT_506173 [Calocera cornea HHB12733]
MCSSPCSVCCTAYPKESASMGVLVICSAEAVPARSKKSRRTSGSSPSHCAFSTLERTRKVLVFSSFAVRIIASLTLSSSLAMSSRASRCNRMAEPLAISFTGGGVQISIAMLTQPEALSVCEDNHYVVCDTSNGNRLVVEIATSVLDKANTAPTSPTRFVLFSVVGVAVQDAEFIVDRLWQAVRRSRLNPLPIATVIGEPWHLLPSLSVNIRRIGDLGPIGAYFRRSSSAWLERFHISTMTWVASSLDETIQADTGSLLLRSSEAIAWRKDGSQDDVQYDGFTRILNSQPRSIGIAAQSGEERPPAAHDETAMTLASC